MRLAWRDGVATLLVAAASLLGATALIAGVLTVAAGSEAMLARPWPAPRSRCGRWPRSGTRALFPWAVGCAGLRRRP